MAKKNPAGTRRIKSTHFAIVSAVATIIFLAMVFNSIVLPKVKAPPAPPSFPQGVASGDVTQNSAILWTRTVQLTPVLVEVSTSADFKKVDFKKTVIALPANDFTAKTVVTSLLPDQRYYYRWSWGAVNSEIGTFKTAPPPGALAATHFAWSGDSDVSKIKVWKALDSARAEGLDFFIYLGDIIYSDKRQSGVADAKTLVDYRQIYKDSRDVSALHNLLLATSSYPVWDDHEIRMDWAGLTVDPTIFQIGSKSFYEYMPIMQPSISPVSKRECVEPPQFKVVHWGESVDLIFVDTRSCRSGDVALACHSDIAPTLPASLRKLFPSFLTPLPPAGCLAAINDPTRTLLGNTQKSLFKEALLKSRATYKFVISSVSIQQTYTQPYGSWEGYAAERSEILNFIRNNHINNVIFLTTDLHLNLMNEVYIDHFTDPTPIAYEFVTGPIAQFADKQIIFNAFSDPRAGQNAIAAKEKILNLVGADCRNLEALSYGSVQVDPINGKAIVSLKDESGNTIHDDYLNPTIACTKTFSR